MYILEMLMKTTFKEEKGMAFKLLTEHKRKKSILSRLAVGF